MHVVNLYAGPGCGKSTLAAALFATMKTAGINCELVTEVAKDLTWESAKGRLAYPPLVFGEQSWKLERLVGQVDVVVTDSPLLLNSYYAWKCRFDDENWHAFVRTHSARFPSTSFLLERSSRPYNPAGRNETEAQARAIDQNLRAMLDRESIPLIRLPAVLTSVPMAFRAVCRDIGWPESGE